MLITVEKGFLFKGVTCNEVSFKVKNYLVESFKMSKIMLIHAKIMLIHAKIFQLIEIQRNY